jgi:hypothetical protein
VVVYQLPKGYQDAFPWIGKPESAGGQAKEEVTPHLQERR